LQIIVVRSILILCYFSVALTLSIPKLIWQCKKKLVLFDILYFIGHHKDDVFRRCFNTSLDIILRHFLEIKTHQHAFT